MNRTYRSMNLNTNNDEDDGMLSEDTWKSYVDRANKEDKERLGGWQADMDSLLLFAALFSAVLTAFVVESYQTLLPDSGDKTVQLLEQILNALPVDGHNKVDSAKAISPFQPTKSNVFVNTVWFISLVLSLSAALLAILAKQWIHNLTTGLSPLPIPGGRQRQFRLDGLLKWRLPSLLMLLPVILHLSLLLFLTGLVGFLWAINFVVAVCVSALVATTVLLYVISHLIPPFQEASPYKTPLTFAIYSGMIAANKTSIFIQRTLKVLWSILIGSLKYFVGIFRNGEPGIPNLSQEYIHWRQELHNAYPRILTRGFYSKMEEREEYYIHELKREIDASALVRLVESSAKLEDTQLEALMREMLYSGRLLMLQTRFIKASAVRLFVQHLALIHTNIRSHTLQKRQHVLQCADGLVQLVTETADENVEISDNGLNYFEDIPHHLSNAIYDMWLTSQHVPRSPLIEPISFSYDIPEKLLFDTYMLRLHVAMQWQQNRGLRQFRLAFSPRIDPFYRSLFDSRRSLEALSDHDQDAVFNTIIFIETHTDKIDFPKSLNLLHCCLSLTPAIRFQSQIKLCWGIYVLSQLHKGNHSSVIVPVPHMKCMRSLSGFFSLLSVQEPERPQFLCAFLKATDSILFTQLQIIIQNGTYYNALSSVKPQELSFPNYLKMFTDSYPAFLSDDLNNFCARLDTFEIANVRQIIVHIARLTCLLLYVYPNAPSAVLNRDILIERICKPTLELLVHISNSPRHSGELMELQLCVCGAIGWLGLKMLELELKMPETTTGSMGFRPVQEELDFMHENENVFARYYVAAFQKLRQNGEIQPHSTVEYISKNMKSMLSNMLILGALSGGEPSPVPLEMGLGSSAAMVMTQQVPPSSVLPPSLTGEIESTHQGRNIIWKFQKCLVQLEFQTLLTHDRDVDLLELMSKVTDAVKQEEKTQWRTAMEIRSQALRWKHREVTSEEQGMQNRIEAIEAPHNWNAVWNKAIELRLRYPSQPVALQSDPPLRLTLEEAIERRITSMKPPNVPESPIISEPPDSPLAPRATGINMEEATES